MIVHREYGRYHKKYPHCPKEVPMELLNEEWAQHNHSQSLEALNERGGMCPVELVANIEKRNYTAYEKKDEEEYIQKLIKYIENFNPPPYKGLNNKGYETIH